ncbi:uncharacterized protein [Asterias amurensis]|uniref:uncharacterized protein isoform X4 n=1 Tax=Asterias amurensis TaxID=7602 RepID=UPI003AB1C6D6
MKFTLLSFLVPFLVLRSGTCRSTGAPSEACSTLTPSHSGSPQPSNTSSYQLELVSGNTYAAGGTVTVRLSANPSTTTFKGVIMQARQVLDGSVVGSWQLSGSDYQHLACPGDTDGQGTITHTDGQIVKTLPVTFTWNAPVQLVGDLEFQFSVVQEYVTYWTNMKSSIAASSTPPCLSNPCLNGATCLTGTNSYVCSCTAGFTGTNCQTATNPTPPCLSDPCQNGATCLPGTNSYTCVCDAGFTGINCQTASSTPPCLSNPCLNGATCLTGTNSYVCSCTAGFTGTNCQTATNPTPPCLSDPCLNGATCLTGTNSYVCQCAAGFTGTNCQTASSTPPCLSNPCLNGATCFTGTNSYVCSCTAGFTGTNCQTSSPTPCISNPCQNGATCSPGTNSYTCVCDAGFTGINCQTATSPTPPCLSDPCLNGATCLTGTNSYVCQCATGFTGTNCQITSPTPPCLSNPCLNGATCLTGTSSYVCSCTAGFTGTNCQTASPTPPCLSDPCLNGATCLPGTNSYVCSCTADFTGTNCQTASPTPSCLSNPCLNGATCLTGTNSYVCSCTADFTGTNCQNSLDSTPPVVTCPADFSSDIPIGSSGKQESWALPTATDNSGSVVFVSSTHNPNDFFPVGETTIMYTYRDASNNINTCSFTLTIVEGPCASVTCFNGGLCQVVGTSFTCLCVIGFTGQFCQTAVTDDHQAPTVIGCPDPINVNLTQGSSDVVVTWTEPSTSETTGVSVTKTHQPGSTFTDGVTTVLYTFTDQAGNSTICTFNVTVSTTDEAPPVDSTTTIVIICMIILVVILVFVCLVYFLRYRKRKPQEPTRDQEMTGYENRITPDDTINTAAIDSGSVGQNLASGYEPVRDVHVSQTYEDVGLPTWAEPWNVLWDNIIVGTQVLRKGQFGEVLYGGVMIAGELCKAAIKKLQEHASPAERKIFLDEFLSMTKIGHHPNIVMLLGACQHEGELYVAMEYLPNGDLRSYLRNARSMDDEESMSSDKLLQFALDVAKGMQHLAATGMIHRDLAARNILLDENLVAKISDYGLSRGEDTYVQTSQTRVPARWLSLESLTSKTYTTESDVWSYGILLWEIVTAATT